MNPLQVLLVILSTAAVKAQQHTFAKPSSIGEGNETVSRTDNHQYSVREEDADEENRDFLGPQRLKQYDEIYTRTIVRPAEFSYISATVPLGWKTNKVAHEATDPTEMEFTPDEVSGESKHSYTLQAHSEDERTDTAFVRRRAVLPGNDLFLSESVIRRPVVPDEEYLRPNNTTEDHLQRTGIFRHQTRDNLQLSPTAVAEQTYSTNVNLPPSNPANDNSKAPSQHIFPPTPSKLHSKKVIKPKYTYRNHYNGSKKFDSLVKNSTEKRKCHDCLEKPAVLSPQASKERIERYKPSSITTHTDGKETSEIQSRHQNEKFYIRQRQGDKNNQDQNNSEERYNNKYTEPHIPLDLKRSRDEKEMEEEETIIPESDDQAESASIQEGEKGEVESHKGSHGGSEHQEHHESKESKKGEKGYKKASKHEKASKGHHDKEEHSGEYHTKKGEDKEKEKGEKVYGEHEKEEKGKKGKKYEGGKHHKKGHSTHGEHNIVKKDEYIKTTKFYDEDHDGGEEEEHGEYDAQHRHKNGGKKEEGHHHHAAHKEDFSKKGHHDKGHGEDELSGHKHDSGHEDSYEDEEEYGHKKGEKKTKTWKER